MSRRQRSRYTPAEIVILSFAALSCVFAVFVLYRAPLGITWPDLGIVDAVKAALRLWQD
jgi:hypothetical protein